jgi:iron complex transport system substrate-binding protein
VGKNRDGCRHVSTTRTARHIDSLLGKSWQHSFWFTGHGSTMAAAELGARHNVSVFHMKKRYFAFIVAITIANSCAIGATISVEDETGVRVELAKPAQRIVSLAPHNTEILFAVGAGENIVGAVEYSDYPEAANKIPRVGGYQSLDKERIIALKPDLVVAWKSGNSDVFVTQLRRLGMPVYVNEIRRLDDIPRTMENLGVLTANENSAQRAAKEFRLKLQTLRDQYAQRRPVRVFYQIWNKPVTTIGGEQIISHVIELCGGRNIFADLRSLAPAVNTEDVIQANPDVIIVSGMGVENPEWMDTWRRWTRMNAVKNHQLYFVPADLMQRPSPRLLDGAEIMCREIDDARKTMEGEKQ